MNIREYDQGKRQGLHLFFCMLVYGYTLLYNNRQLYMLMKQFPRR
jgi:hypothetical protein